METVNEFYIEAVAEAAEAAGIEATPEQIREAAEFVQGAVENICQAFYAPADSPAESELDRVKKELEAERQKVFCTSCSGNGRIFERGPYHGAWHDCHVCGGRGKI